MRSILLATAAIVTTLLAACTYTHTTNHGEGTFIQHPDGTIEGEWTNYSTNRTVKLHGDSVREIARQIPRPRLDTENSDVVYEYRYEYRFRVYDFNDDFVDTLVVRTLDDALDMVPLFFDLSGINVPA